jgi:plastocyanin
LTTRQLLFVCAVIAATSCSKGYDTPTSPSSSNPIPAGPTTVLIPSGTAASNAGPGFAPTPITVAAGTTVTFGNNDGTLHTSTSDAPGWNLSLNAHASGAVKLDTPGTYTYHCNIHAFMKGTVIVQ